jgi:hypothetical protein
MTLPSANTLVKATPSMIGWYAAAAVASFRNAGATPNDYPGA